MSSNAGVSPLNSLKEDTSSTRTERLYNRFKKLIVSGEFPAGYVFPNENEMCQMLQIGRGTLRESYRALSTNGLITRSKTGTVVNDMNTILSTAPFSIVAEFSGFQDILEFRLMLESESAKYAAMRAQPEELEQLAAVLAESRKTREHGALQKLDLDFHRSIVHYSHNPLLISVFLNVWDAFESILVKNYSRLSIASPQTVIDAVNQHSAVFDAIAAHNAAAAMDAMRRHISAVYGDPGANG